jgi:hypothetical protein
MAMDINDAETTQSRRRQRTLRRFLEDEIWPRMPSELRDKPPMTKAEREDLLGYGPEGV